MRCPPSPPRSTDQVLSGAFTVLEWDPAAITDVVNRLTPRNCQVRVLLLSVCTVSAVKCQVFSMKWDDGAVAWPEMESVYVCVCLCFVFFIFSLFVLLAFPRVE